MLGDLESHILKLHECLSGTQNPDFPRSIVSDIVYICGENINQQTICEY